MHVRGAILGGWCVVTMGCGGGFYRVDDAVQKAPVQKGTLGDFGYVTATINLQNSDLFASSTYIDSRDGNLAHLYVYAQFPNSPAGTSQAIPLYLIDLDKGSIVDTRGAELISHYPINADSRGSTAFTIETRALKRTVGDTALKVWQLSGGLAQKVAGMSGPQATALFDVVNQGAGILGNLASTDQSHEAHVVIPKNYDKPEYADIYLILPTDKHGEALEAVKNEATSFVSAADITLCRDDSNLMYACKGGSHYKGLPYIIVDFQLQNHVSDSALLEHIDSACNIKPDQLKAAQERVEVPGVLSDPQLDLERVVNDRAGRLLQLRSALSDGKQSAAMDIYDDYVSLPPLPETVKASSLYTTIYAARIKALNDCTTVAEKAIPGYEAADGLLKYISTEVDFDNAAEAGRGRP